MEEIEYCCYFCGRKLNKPIRAYGHIYCNKHYNQFKKYGKVLDYNPRTIYDRNEYRILGDVTEMDLYNKNQEVIGHVLIDTEDLDRVRNTKWKLSGSGYAMNTPKFKGGSRHMSRQILQTDQFVDHINHNTLDNRKSNLRIVTKSQNQMNSNYRGVTDRPDGKYYAHIKIDQKMINLGVYVFEEEALFARWYAETLIFGDYRYPKEKPQILADREASIRDYVEKKVQRL